MSNETPGRRWPFIAGFVLFFVGASALLPDFMRPGVNQPVAFDHRKHVVTVELACETCHTTAATRPYAGLPTVDLCMECHEEAQTDSPEEEKLRAFAETGAEIPWVRLFQQPGHVYYSHRRHVELAGLSCETCHGAIAERTGSDRSWPDKLSMEDCMACHEASQVRNDCTECHK